MVDLFIDEMNRQPRGPDPVVKRTLYRVFARECGEQRGMDVEHPLGETIEKARGKDSHESGEYHPLRATPLDGIGEGGAERITTVEIGPRQDDGRNPRSLGPTQTWSIADVGDDEGYMGSNRRVVDECLQIGARTRCENCDVDVGPPDLGRGGSVGLPAGRTRRQPLPFRATWIR